ncbi:Tyrosine-protein kinase receptor Tie-2 [Stylophora pistillata]|uniref:Tyrosine-protein kinase receptor Tie-2 n=1 Tax=Stylophora pistillata TaxID=50429 RepID=A0A2B4RGQ9_STYPI|nr:Tyrosine-protein kinase receptor Tie-2 [Stylophora pistillata]
MDLLNICLTSTYFQYNGKHYKQLHGTAMGSPVSVVIAEIVMQNIEERALSTCRQTIPLWLRYVDDTFTAVRHDEIDAFHNHLNEQNTDIQFTREVEENGKLPFLDCLVSHNDNSLRTTVYRKPTHTDRLLDESSYNPTSHKATTIRTLTRRAQLVCDSTDSLSDENKYLHRVFTKNNYNNDFIRRNTHRPTTTTETNDTATPTTTATIPYIKGMSENISRILLPFNIRVAHKPITTLRQLLTNVKDKDEPRNRQGTIYKINCSDCQASYIGETGRNLTTRLTEHRRATRKDDASESDKRDLINELYTMKQLKPHPRVIRLLGCVTESGALLVLIEYVPFGDLLGYLRKSRGLNDTYFDDPDIRPQTNLTSQQLMKFSWQIADGMSYLSSKSGIKKAIGPTESKSSPLKTSTGEIITDKSRLMKCWVEYYSELYGRSSSVLPSVLDCIERLPIMFEIDGPPPRKISQRQSVTYRLERPLGLTFSDACEAFRLTISLKKTKVMSQDNAATPAVTITDYILEAATQFTYLGSTTSNNECLEVEIGKRSGKAATNMAKLSSRLWENNKLTTQSKVAVYRACIVSTLLFASESWTTYASQEKRLNIFHMRCLRRILSISWTDKVSNNEVLARANIPSMFTLIRKRRLRWLGNVYQMEDGRIPKDLLYGELESGSRPIGRPKLRFKDVCKRDMLATGLPTDNWELHAADRSDWRSVCSLALQAGEERLKAEADDRRAKRRAAMNKATFLSEFCELLVQVVFVGQLDRHEGSNLKID